MVLEGLGIHMQNNEREYTNGYILIDIPYCMTFIPQYNSLKNSKIYF